MHVDDTVGKYILDLTRATRAHDQVQLGASSRGAVSFYEACQARALVEGRDYVTPGDVKAMAVPVLSHRLIVRSRGSDLASAARERIRVVHDILKRVEVPV